MASTEFFMVLLHGEGKNCVFSGTYFPLKPVCTQFDVFNAYILHFTFGPLCMVIVIHLTLSDAHT